MNATKTKGIENQELFDDTLKVAEMAIQYVRDAYNSGKHIRMTDNRDKQPNPSKGQTADKILLVVYDECIPVKLLTPWGQWRIGRGDASKTECKKMLKDTLLKPLRAKKLHTDEQDKMTTYVVCRVGRHRYENDAVMPVILADGEQQAAKDAWTRFTQQVATA